MTLLQIKEKLEQFQVVKCDMYHEKIKLDIKTGQPISKETSNGSSYERVNLCGVVERSKRLGCAHSSSNNNFLNLIDELKTNDQEIINFKKRISDLILQIYTLDHKKGELEKELVISNSLDDAKEKTIKVQEALTDSILAHRKIMNKLKTLKTKLILHLEELV